MDQQGQQLDGELQAGHQECRHVEQLVVVEEAEEDDHSHCDSEAQVEEEGEQAGQGALLRVGNPARGKQYFDQTKLCVFK